MAEVQLVVEDDRVEDKVEVSGPLDIRKFQGNARCSRCKEANRDCYLERKQGDLHCLTCNSAEECLFRRIVVRESVAAAFSWEELIGDEAADGAHAVDLPPRKRPHYAASVDDQSSKKAAFNASFRRGLEQISSLKSEPASQVRTQVSLSPYATRNTNTTDLFMQPAYGSDPNVDNAGSWLDPSSYPYTPGGMPNLVERQSSVTHNLTYASDQLHDVLNLDPGYRPSWNDSRPADLTRFSTLPVQQSSQPHLHIKRSSPPAPKSVSAEPASKFSCLECNIVFTTQSETSKHMARHMKKFLCDYAGCPRGKEGQGFATKNDLARHKGSVHNDPSVPRREYRCSVPSCKDPNKIWDRRDNFRAHVKRMHPGVNADEYEEKSRVR